MKLLYRAYGCTLPLVENRVHRLCIEQPLAYREIVRSIYQQCSGGDGGAILSDGIEPLPLHKLADVLLEPFSLQFDSKKMSSKLYKELEHIVLEELYADYTDLQGTLLTFMDKLLLKVPYPVMVEDMVEAKELFKLMKCRIDYGCTTLSEALCGYVTLLAQLCGVKVLFLVDCEKYLTDDERQALQQTANYHKIILVHIEASSERLAADDVYCIVDKDYCVLSNADDVAPV